jgi:hypothetical protein
MLCLIKKMDIDQYNEIDSYLVNEQIKEINSPDSNIKMKVAFVNYWYVKRLDLASRIRDKNIRDNRVRHINGRMDAWRQYVVATNVFYPTTPEEYDVMFKFN